MSYADTLPIMAAQHREELRAIERERARTAHKMHGLMCAEVRKAMLEDFYDRVRCIHVPVQTQR